MPEYYDFIEPYFECPMGTPIKKYHSGLSLIFLGQTPPEQQNCEQLLVLYFSLLFHSSPKKSYSYVFPHLAFF